MQTGQNGDIRICLWFDGQAEAAVEHYLGIFRDGRRTDGFRPSGGKPALTVGFELRGRTFLALNGGPLFKFSPAVSLIVDCADQEEIDYYWERLSDGGAKSRCGWLQDKFGLSWQIVPRDPPRLLSRGPAVMEALMKMDKLDIALLERAGARAEETKP